MFWEPPFDGDFAAMLNFKGRSFLIILSLILISGNLAAQKRRPPKKPPMSAKRKSGSKTKGKPSSGPSELFFWAEAFGSYMPCLHSGSYFDYQKQYYLTENPGFKISGKFSRDYSPYGGAGIQVGLPVKSQFIKFVSGGLAFSLSRRQLSHEVVFTNDSLRYRNKITIQDQLSASYLGTELQFRFGSKLYALLGIRNDFLLSGYREKSLRVEGDSIMGGKPLESSQRWSLKKSELVRQSNLGWHAAIGYAPLPYLGVRFGFLYTGTFFKEGPDFATQQYYLAICLSFVK